MSWNAGFVAAADLVAARLDPVQVEALAKRIGAGASEHAVLEAVPAPGFADLITPLLTALRVSHLTNAEAGAYLRGLASGRRARGDEVRVQSVWTGPSSHSVPVRVTAQVLVGLIAEASVDLVLTTYSARPYAPVQDALRAAVSRGVRVDIIVETLEGAGSALSGAQPAAAFAGIDGLRLWHWPAMNRGDSAARMHAKLAVADRRVLLISSANLTQSGADRNIEAGLLVQGGAAPARTAEHLTELMARGILARLTKPI